MPRLRSGRVVSTLIAPALIAGAMFGMNHAGAADAPLAAPTWGDSGMQLEMRPPVEPKPVAALAWTPAPLPASAPPPTPAVGSIAASPMEHGNPLWAVPLRLLHNTRERPLFSSSRRPAPPPAPVPPPSVAAAPPPPPKPSRPDLKLIGTIIGDRESIGVFEDGTAKILRLHTGEGHEGWVLRRVELRSVTLDNDTNRAVLALPATGTDLQDAIPSPYARGTRRVHH